MSVSTQDLDLISLKLAHVKRCWLLILTERKSTMFKLEPSLLCSAMCSSACLAPCVVTSGCLNGLPADDLRSTYTSLNRRLRIGNAVQYGYDADALPIRIDRVSPKKIKKKIRTHLRYTIDALPVPSDWSSQPKQAYKTQRCFALSRTPPENMSRTTHRRPSSSNLPRNFHRLPAVSCLHEPCLSCELLCFLFVLQYFARNRPRASFFAAMWFKALRVEVVVSLPVRMKLTTTNMIS